METSYKENIQKNKKFNFQTFLSKYGIVLALAILCIALSSISGAFLKEENLINVLRQVAINGILAIGMTFVILTGGIDLSVGSMVAFSGVIVAGLIRSGSNIGIAMAIALIAPVILGAISGTVIAKWNVAPFIMTLAMMTVARGFTFVYADGKPISGLPQSFLTIGKGSFIGIPIPVWILGITYMVCHFILKHTSIGRYIYAVGGNENAALVSGINVKWVKTIVYIISGLLSGVAAIVLTARVAVGLPQAGVSYELDAIAAVVIGGTSLSGGKGRLWGTIIGALILGVVNNGLDLMNVDSYYQQIVKGCIIVAAVLIDSKKK